MKAPVIETRFHDANPVAKLNMETFANAGVLAISISGGPGCGKTSLIEAAIARLAPAIEIGVIACDVSSHKDADRIELRCNQVVQVNTGQQGFPDATHIRDALRWLDLSKIDLLFIENVGTLLCTGQVGLGQSAGVAIFSVAGGDDKADKHPELVQSSDCVVLNKTDLLKFVPFDLITFRDDVSRLNANARLFELSALNGDGLAPFTDWLKARVAACQAKTSNNSDSIEDLS